MQRDPDALTGRTFDVLVVGGGIYGLIIAYDAAQRGLSVALIDQADFGSGASFNHLRTIHGGLRYLQTLDVARGAQSAIERRARDHRRTPSGRCPCAPPTIDRITQMRLWLTGRRVDRTALSSLASAAGARRPGDASELRAASAGATGAAVGHDYVTTEVID